MARPVVTCGTDITYVWNHGGGATIAALTATATNSPTGWEWTILSVPTGLEAILIGSHGDFTDGVATIQNPSLSVPTAVAAGSIVVQCVAYNGPLPSDRSNPSADKQNGQQIVGILDPQGILYPGDYEYDWGKRILTPLLRAIAFKAQVTSTDIIPGQLSSKLSAGAGIAFSTLNPGGDEQIEITAEPADTLKSATTSIDIGSAAAPTAGQVLTATSGTAATWQDPVSEFGGHEEEFIAAGGDENFVLAAIPAANANMLSGRNILGVYRNGQRLRYRASPATTMEYGFTATQTINCKNLSIGDIVTVVYLASVAT